MTASFDDRVVKDLDRGEILDGDFRYMMIRADALMGMFRRLDPATRLRALDAFRDSIIEFGGKSAAAYRAGLGPDEARRLTEVIADTAPRLGWGCWTFLDVGRERMHVLVRNSPFVAGFGAAEHPVCHPIIGMLTVVGGMVLGRPVTVAEIACVARDGGETCRFEAVPLP